MLDLSSMFSQRVEKIQYKQDNECYIYIIYQMTQIVKTIILALKP